MKKTMMILTAAVLAAALFAGCATDTASGSVSGSSKAAAGSSSASSAEDSSLAASSAADSSLTEETSAAEQANTYYDEFEMPAETEDGIKIVDGEVSSSDCVTLPEYKGLKLTKSVTKVTDESVDEYIDSLNVASEVEDPDATVQEGDTVNIDYVGTIDGEAFNGGTAEGTDLVIGSGTFIEGFEDGLIGMKVGETRDLELTFPEDYGNEELAGKDATFNVTLNSISRKSEINDEWVNENTGGEYTTVADFRKATKKMLKENNEQSAQTTLEEEAYQQVYDGCVFTQLPASYVLDGVKAYSESMLQNAEYYGMSVDEFLEQMGYTAEDYVDLLFEYGVQVAKNRVLIEALWEREGFSTDDDEYQELKQEVCDTYGYDEATMIEYYGEAALNDYVKSLRTSKYIVDNADVTVEEVDPLTDTAE